MAEINIERKEQNAWPWLLAGAAVLVLLWFVFTRNSPQTTTASRADSAAFRDTSAAAGTLAPTDAGVRRDSLRDSFPVPR